MTKRPAKCPACGTTVTLDLTDTFLTHIRATGDDFASWNCPGCAKVVAMNLDTKFTMVVYDGPKAPHYNKPR